MSGWVGNDGLTDAQMSVVYTVRVAASFSKVPSYLNPELRPSVFALRAGKSLKDKEIIERVEEEVELNSRLY